MLIPQLSTSVSHLAAQVLSLKKAQRAAGCGKVKPSSRQGVLIVGVEIDAAHGWKV